MDDPGAQDEHEDSSPNANVGSVDDAIAPAIAKLQELLAPQTEQLDRLERIVSERFSGPMLKSFGEALAARSLAATQKFADALAPQQDAIRAALQAARPDLIPMLQAVTVPALRMDATVHPATIVAQARVLDASVTVTDIVGITDFVVVELTRGEDVGMWSTRTQALLFLAVLLIFYGGGLADERVRSQVEWLLTVAGFGLGGWATLEVWQQRDD